MNRNWKRRRKKTSTTGIQYTDRRIDMVKNDLLVLYNNGDEKNSSHRISVIIMKMMMIVVIVVSLFVRMNLIV